MHRKDFVKGLTLEPRLLGYAESYIHTADWQLMQPVPQARPVAQAGPARVADDEQRGSGRREQTQGSNSRQQLAEQPGDSGQAESMDRHGSRQRGQMIV